MPTQPINEEEITQQIIEEEEEDVISPENRRAQVKAIMEKIEKEGLGPGETFEGKLKAELRRQNAAERAAEFTRDHPNLEKYIEEVMKGHEQHSSGFSRHNDHRKARPKGAYPNPVPDPDPDSGIEGSPETERRGLSRGPNREKVRARSGQTRQEAMEARARARELAQEEAELEADPDVVIEGERIASRALKPNLQPTAVAPHPTGAVFAGPRRFNPELTGRNHRGGSRKSKHSKKKNTLRKASRKVSRKQTRKPTRKPTRKASRKSSRKQSRKQSRKPTKKSKKKKASRN